MSHLKWENRKWGENRDYFWAFLINFCLHKISLEMLNVTFWVIFKHCVQRSCCPGQANIWSFLSSIAREDLYHQKTSQTKITRNCDHWTHCKKITNYVQKFNFLKKIKMWNQNFCWKSHVFCESLNGQITRKIWIFAPKSVFEFWYFLVVNKF